MISKGFKMSIIAIGIITMLIIGGVMAVPYVREYDTNAPVADDEWNQYRWQGEAADFLLAGAVVVPGPLYKGGAAVSLPPGATAQYLLYYPPSPGATIHVKHGIYRMFFYADTTNAPGVQTPVDISVYIDFDYIQIDTTTWGPAGTTGLQSPAANGHAGVIDVGLIDFSDEPHTIPLNYHWIEISNIDGVDTIIIDEIVISTAN